MKPGSERDAHVSPVPWLVDVVLVVFGIGEHKAVFVRVFGEPFPFRSLFKCSSQCPSLGSGEVDCSAELVFGIALVG
jgi:hypothetical protein